MWWRLRGALQRQAGSKHPTNSNWLTEASPILQRPRELPKGIDDALHRPNGDYEPDRRLLSKETDSSFTPSLAKLRDWIRSLKSSETKAVSGYCQTGIK